jgi:two-component system KDP operon response regulator KdpE
MENQTTTIVNRILVVDDENRYLRLLQINLATEGYEVTTATNGAEAIDIITSRPIDLVLMDIVMPKLDGISTLERIRQFTNIPIIMLTGRNSEEDKVRCLNLGADDYITKPFSATEVLARVRAVLRRNKTNQDDNNRNIFINNYLKIDYARAEVWCNDKTIFLTATEYKLLIQFALNIGKVLSADELLTSIWGPHYKDDKEILWVSIARLRQKLEKNPRQPELIITRSGLGYIMPALMSN